MTIPLVVQGLVEIEESGKVFELDSPKGAAWLESIGSFRFEPVGDNKPYTVRKEAGKGGDYWYGYRKQNGKLHKKYIGKSSEINTAKLEEIAEALNTPPQPRVTERNTLGVTYIAKDGLCVTPRIENSDRLTALELQVQALQESLEALRSELPGKFAEGDSSELPKSDTVTDGELQIRVGNLEPENEKLKADYAALLESSTHVTNKLRQEVQELRSQLATERADREELDAELADLAQLKKEVKEHAAELHREQRSTELEKARWQQELSDARCELADAKATILKQSDKIRELERGYSLKPNPAESRLRLEIGELNQQLADLKQNSAPASQDLPEAADLLNRLKAKRKKSAVTLADVEAILEMIEG